MFSVTSTLFLSIIIPLCFSADLVPVLMWDSFSGDSALKSIPVLSKVNQNEFKGILTKKLRNDPVVIVFVEENLSIEDLSWKDESGNGAFPNLHNLSRSSDADLIYLPFVESPLSVLEHMFPQNPGWNEAILGPEGIPILSEDTPYSNFLRVNLEDAKVSDVRSDLLKRHDSTIFNIYQGLRENHDHVIAIYTSLHSSWHGEEDIKSRRAREVEEGTEHSDKSRNKYEEEGDEPFGTSEQKDTTIPKASAEPESTSSSSLPSSSTALPSPKPTQAPEPLPPFMTIPILSGLMVTSILLGILGFAISAMMDIKPTLRFDDPKGKTLTFAVSE